MPTFTLIGLTLAVAALVCDAPVILTTACYCNVFIFASFHVVCLFDRTAYARMRRKNKWNVFTFYIGDAFLHGLPTAVLVRRLCACFGSIHSWQHVVSSIVSHVLFVCWAMCKTGHKFPHCLCLDDVYVALRPRLWILAEMVGVTATCLVPVIMSRVSCCEHA